MELESKIREREVETEKRDKELEKREIEITRKEEKEKKKKEEENERERLEKAKEEEKIRLEEEEKIRLEKTKKEEGKKILNEIMKEQQRKMKEIEAQIKAMTKEVKTPTMFFGVSWKVESFVKECREYVEIKMKEKTVEDQILWVMTCMDGGIVDRWKEMMKDDLKEGLREYVTLEEFFGEIRKEFGRKGKGKKTEEEIERGMDRFWNAVEEKKKPKVEAMTPRISAVGRGSGFWKR